LECFRRQRRRHRRFFNVEAILPPVTRLDSICMADEAATRLRLTNRALIKIERKYGYCSRFGRDYLFSEPDLLGIWQALREPKKVPRPAAGRLRRQALKKQNEKPGFTDRIHN
jgi:hypothetical protein